MENEFNFSPFYLSFLYLCKRDGISPTKAAKKAGIASGAPTAWKTKGSIPRPDQRDKLCALFGVTENELLGYEAQKEKPPGEGELNKEEKEIIDLYNRASPELRAAALAMLRAAEDARKAQGEDEGDE